ncbi:MAG: thioredoxin domain-containing protein [Deltaproteobacteria bacterium]|nr:thioredoxin domain-containing protein [Deltaproteobacteria bacterium]
MPNRLAAEQSPYLRQHADNPVDWYPWGDAAFAAARATDRPIFLSIGYSTCHWCHVMAHDSFERADVAAVLNRHFISVKVDREEHPDVDQIYMDAAVALHGHGGWPLSAFLDHERRPFFAATFFWRDQFLQLLEQLATLWRADRARIVIVAAELTTVLRRPEPQEIPGTMSDAIVEQAVAACHAHYDPNAGGFGSAPKFPPSTTLQWLLRTHLRTRAPQTVEMVIHTLDQMARGGLHDQLGGGFHRYATDAAWRVPHFEKMLYDNALLATTYAEAFAVTRTPRFETVARSTLDYVLRDLTDPSGVFYAAEDADSEGREGAFYVWTVTELQAALTQESHAAFAPVYGVCSEGNFQPEHGDAVGENILFLPPELSWEAVDVPLIAAARAALLAVRAQRVRPSRDEKIVTGWNGLMISALATAARTCAEPRYTEAAHRAADALRTHVWRAEQLFRCADAPHAACLEDYAYLIHGLLALYAVDQDCRWLAWAQALQAAQDVQLWDTHRGGYFFSPEAGDLIVRQKRFDDGACPAPNAVAVGNLLRLYELTHEATYRTRAEQLLEKYAARLAQAPMAYLSGLIAWDATRGANLLNPALPTTCTV